MLDWLLSDKYKLKLEELLGLHGELFGLVREQFIDDHHVSAKLTGRIVSLESRLATQEARIAELERNRT